MAVVDYKGEGISLSFRHSWIQTRWKWGHIFTRCFPTPAIGHERSVARSRRRCKHFRTHRRSISARIVCRCLPPPPAPPAHRPLMEPRRVSSLEIACLYYSITLTAVFSISTIIYVFLLMCQYFYTSTLG